MSGVDYAPVNHQPAQPASKYFEGYISLYQDLGRLPVPDVIEGHTELTDIMQATTSGDSLQAATLASEMLGGAVRTGTHELRRAGERGLVSSGDFREKLQDLLRGEFAQAVSVVLPDNDDIPRFPFESRKLIGAVMKGFRREETIRQVQLLLDAEVSLRLANA